MKIPGCTVGSHSDIKPVRPVVASEENGTTAPTRLDSVPVPISQTDVSVTVVPIAPEAKIQVELITPAGMRKCRHAGCMKEYSPDENSDTSCSYHEGVAGFRDTKKFWSCCNMSSYDWDEFMKIPKCKLGRHEPKMINA